MEGEDEGGVFVGTFRAWGSTWRRSLGVSVLAAVLATILIANWLFLLSRESPLAIVMLGGVVPVTV